MRMSSRDAAALIDNDSLDFVYIDANHSFSSTSEDLDLWFPKLKIGGIFSGHDYFDALADDEFEPILHGSKELDVNELTSYGVKSAVDRFVNINNYEITVTNEEWPTWYFIK
ncbi:Methyltransferase domain-containing protein [Sphingomonas sp. YR710]|nr:Methyltransferase domain-containing protein [Sphingomonas sp. YR710]